LGQKQFVTTDQRGPPIAAVLTYQVVGGDIGIFIALIAMYADRHRFDLQFGILCHTAGRRQWIGLRQQLGLYTGQRTDGEPDTTHALGLLLPGDLLDLCYERLTDRQFVHDITLSLRQHLIVKLPGGSCFLVCHFLNGIPDMHHHMIANRQRLMLQHKQTDVALNTLGFTTRHKAVDSANLHGYT